MRQITETSVNAFFNHENMSKANTKVQDNVMYLITTP